MVRIERVFLRFDFFATPDAGKDMIIGPPCLHEIPYIDLLKTYFFQLKT